MLANYKSGSLVERTKIIVHVEEINNHFVNVPSNIIANRTPPNDYFFYLQINKMYLHVYVLQ